MSEVVGAERPLEVAVEGGELVIRIGIGTLAWAADRQDEWSPYDDKRQQFVSAYRVSDRAKFAGDVKRELLREAEDGSSPLSRLLDKMSMAAVNDGSVGVHFYERRPVSVIVRDEKARLAE